MSRHVRRRRVARMASLRGWSPGCRWRLDRRWRDDRTGGLRCPRNRCRCRCLRCGIVRVPSTGAEQQRQPISAARRTIRAGANGFAVGFRFISTSTGIRAPRRDRSSTARRFITASLERLATHPLTLCCVTRTRNPRHHRHLLDAGDLEDGTIASASLSVTVAGRSPTVRRLAASGTGGPFTARAKRKHCPRAIPFPPPSDPAAPGFAAQRPACSPQPAPRLLQRCRSRHRPAAWRVRCRRGWLRERIVLGQRSHQLLPEAHGILIATFLVCRDAEQAETGQFLRIGLQRLIGSACSCSDHCRSPAKYCA